MNRRTFKEIHEAVERATEKHGPMTDNAGIQMSILIEELGECGEAVQDNDPGHYRREILDLIGAAVRILEILPFTDREG